MQLLEELAALLEVSQTDLKPEALLREDLNIDSLGLVEIVAVLDELGVRVTEEDAYQLATVGDVLDLIQMTGSSGDRAVGEAGAGLGPNE